MVGVMWVIVAAVPFMPVDGGFVGQASLPVPHRTVDAFAVARAGWPLFVSDGDAPQTQISITVESAPTPQLDDAGVLLYGDAEVTVAEPLVVRIKRSGSLTIRTSLPLRREGESIFIDAPAASFALIPSAPFEDLGGGQLRITDPTAQLDVQLQVSGRPVPWPMLGGYQSWGASIVWDAARGRLTRFGGGDAFELETETSVWDPMLGWQALPIASPPGRVRASLVYDSIRQKLVLFGGMSAAGPLADTWEFDGAQWTEVTAPDGPSPRWSHGAAFDPNVGEMILFGGLAGTDATNQELGDTWRWDGFTWTELHPPLSPGPRDAFGMTWDPGHTRITLAAGWSGSNAISDAWAWVAGNWHRLPSPPYAARRASTQLAWSPDGTDLLLVGGWDPKGAPGGTTLYLGDTWRFDGTTWSPGPLLPRPTARMALATHPTLGVVMLGGRSDPRLFSAELAKLEPSYQRLPQGEVAERGPVMQPLPNQRSFSFAGERYAWTQASGTWAAFWRPPKGTRVVAAAGDLIVGEIDGGLHIWNTTIGREEEAPPPFQFAGEHLPPPAVTPVPWVVDLDGGLRSYSWSWYSMGNAPQGVRAIRDRTLDEYLIWTDQLARWSPLDGGLIDWGGPLELDGGLALAVLDFPSGQQPLVMADNGSWVLSPSGSWVYVGLPRFGQPITRDILSVDGGLALYEYRKQLGSRCTSASECPTGICTDGRCCLTACTGECEACSVAAGGQFDGTCSFLRGGTVCADNGCSQSVCSGNSGICQEPVACFDAGLEEEMDAGPPSVRDAGVRPRDAGSPEPEPQPQPGCGCEASSGALWFALVFLLRARRRLFHS